MIYILEGVGVVHLIGYIIIIIGVIFMVFGIIGIFRFNNFYPRTLCASKIDTVSTITIFIGLILINGFTFFTIRLLFLMIILVNLNPLIAHLMVRVAYLTGHGLTKYGKDYTAEQIESMDDGSLEMGDTAETKEDYAKEIYDINE